MTGAVRERGARPTAVRDRANRRLGRLIAAVSAIGVAPRDLQTTRIAFVRQHVGSRGARRTVYLAVARLRIRTRGRLNLLSALFAAAARAGAASFSGPSFSFSDPSAGVLAAERAALRNARRRADNAARTLGQRVVGVRSVDLDPDSTGFAPADRSAPQTGSGTGGRRVSTPIRPGRLRVDAAVDVVFLLSS